MSGQAGGRAGPAVNSGKKVLVGAALLAAVAIPFLLRSGMGEAPLENAADLFVNCVENGGLNPTTDPQVLECTQGAIELVHARNGLYELDILLEEALNEDPRVLMVCHTIGHEVAKQGYKELASKDRGKAEQVLSDLFQLPANGCHGAVVHGMLEGWAEDDPDEERFVKLARACEIRPEISGEENEWKALEKIGRCADSLGHSVWNVWQRPEICANFVEAEARVTCGSGMIMQMYQPSGAPSPNIDFELDSLLDLCANWPKELELRGCNAGVAYAFQRPFSDRLAQLTENRPDDQPLTDEEIASTFEALDKSISLCRRLKNDQERHCERSLVVTEPLLTLPRDLVREYCLRLDPQAHGSCFFYNKLEQPAEQDGTGS